MENILEIKDVTKRYPGVVALNHVSFEVAEGRGTCTGRRKRCR